MENAVKFAALISYITHVAGSELAIEDVSNINKRVSELRADFIPLNRLLDAMKLGKKIEAIKEYRTLTGASLLDAKNAVEANWPDHTTVAA